MRNAFHRHTPFIEFTVYIAFLQLDEFEPLGMVLARMLACGVAGCIRLAAPKVAADKGRLVLLLLLLPVVLRIPWYGPIGGRLCLHCRWQCMRWLQRRQRTDLRHH